MGKMRRKTCFEDSGKGVCTGKKTKKGQLYMMCQDCSRMKKRKQQHLRKNGKALQTDLRKADMTFQKS